MLFWRQSTQPLSNYCAFGDERDGRTLPTNMMVWTDLLVMMMAMMIPMMALLMKLGQYITHRQLLGYMFGRVAVYKDASACDVGITQGVSLLPSD
jgi:hypothetical protein